MATRYAVASGVYSDAANVWSDTDGGAPGSYVPVDGDTFVVLAGVNVKMDIDMSAWTGLAGANTIRGGATPGMLYFANGDDGHLKFRTGATLVGTTSTNRGRLLANSDGSWGTTTALQNSNKAVIDMQGTAKIIATDLDIALYCTQPANLFVHCYGTKYNFTGDTAVDPATDIIDLGTPPPAAGTDVILLPNGAAVLPTGLLADCVYYVRAVVGNTCKLALTNSDTPIVDITADGSGTISMLTEQASGTAILNVFEDVTADAPWSAAAGHDRVVLADALAPESYDQQRTTIASIDSASQITLAENVDSAQFAGARLYLSSRNISVRSYNNVATQNIVEYSTDSTHGGVFQCEIVNTYGTGTSFYGSGINYGSGHTMSGTVMGCTYGINSGSGHTISGTMMGCNFGINSGSGHTISGTVMGCNYGINSGSGHTISGTMMGCNFGIYSGSGHTMSGTMMGCTYGIYYGSGNTISGTMMGCNFGIYYGSGHTMSGTMMGCNYGIYSGSGHTISGTMMGCNYGIYYGSGNTISGTVKNNTYDFRFPAGNITVKSGADVTYNLYERNVVGYIGRISQEDFGQVFGTHKVTDAFGDVLKTACDGTGDAPSQDPDGANGYCVEASNIQLNLSSINPLLLVPNQRIWLTAAEHTITFKVQTTYAGISAGNLKLSASYISTESPVARTVATNAPAISQRGSATDWTQTLAVTITPAVAGFVDLKIELMEYEDGNEVYIWPTPVIS